MRRSILLLAAAALVVGLVAPAQAKPDSRPFKGSLSGSVAFVPFTEGCHGWGVDLGSVGHATGDVSHLGRTHMTSVHCTPEFGVAEVTGGSMTLTAANGDEVFMTYEGIAPVDFPEVLEMELEFEIVGGTGRFANAGGGGSMTAFVVNEGFEDFEWPATWVWSGHIGY